MAEMPHMRRREGDEYFCPRCLKRWGVEEDDPGPCIEDKRDFKGGPGAHYRRVDSSKSLRPADTSNREQIEQIWREVNGHPDHFCLAGSDAEWAFFEALLLTNVS